MTPEQTSFLDACYPSNKWVVGTTCRYCHKPVKRNEAVITHSYWNAVWQVAHKACDADGRKAEAYECQIIDADCNDCKHFNRGESLASGVSAAWSGQCLKYDKPVVAYPNKATGNECFEHRREP
jgi:hypothetical protein